MEALAPSPVSPHDHHPDSALFREEIFMLVSLLKDIFGGKRMPDAVPPPAIQPSAGELVAQVRSRLASDDLPGAEQACSAALLLYPDDDTLQELQEGMEHAARIAVT